MAYIYTYFSVYSNLKTTFKDYHLRRHLLSWSGNRSHTEARLLWNNFVFRTLRHVNGRRSRKRTTHPFISGLVGRIQPTSSRTTHLSFSQKGTQVCRCDTQSPCKLHLFILQIVTEQCMELNHIFDSLKSWNCIPLRLLLHRSRFHWKQKFKRLIHDRNW